MKKGVIYIAFGAKYVREAIHSANSLKLHNTGLHVTIFTDDAVSDSSFDRVTLIDPAHRRAKVDVMCHSPYDQTIYLDSDTEVLMDITDLFEILEKFDLAAAQDHNRKGARASSLIPPYDAIPYAFSELNSGVVAFRKNEKTRAFFDLWQRTYYTYQTESRGLDQPSFRISLWNSDLKVHILPLEYNVRSKNVRQKLLTGRGAADRHLLEPRIFHWHGLDRGALFSALRKRRKALRV